MSVAGTNQEGSKFTRTVTGGFSYSFHVLTPSFLSVVEVQSGRFNVNRQGA